VGVTRLAKSATSARKIRILVLYLAVGKVDTVVVDLIMVVTDIVAVMALRNRAMDVDSRVVVVPAWTYKDAVREGFGRDEYPHGGYGTTDMDKVTEKKDMEVLDIHMALVLLRHRFAKRWQERSLSARFMLLLEFWYHPSSPLLPLHRRHSHYHS
jgi:hypothetical protein